MPSARLVVLFPRIEPGYRSGPAGRDFRFRPLILGLILVAIVMVWAWRRALDPVGPDAIALGLAVAGVPRRRWRSSGSVIASVGQRALDPMVRFYPPFRDFYAGWRTFDTYCGPRAPAWPMPGPISLTISWDRACATRSATSTSTDIATGCCTTTIARRWPRPGNLAEFPAGLGSDPARLSGLAGQPRRRGNPAPGRHARSTPPKGAHNVADAEGFPIERRWADVSPRAIRPAVRSGGARPLVPAVPGDPTRGTPS